MPKKSKSKLTRQGRAFHEIAAAHGYDPGEYLVQMRKRLESELMDYIDGEHGHHGGERERQALIAKYRRELYEIDRELMPYVHPKLKASESNVHVEGEQSVTVEIVSYADKTPA